MPMIIRKAWVIFLMGILTCSCTRQKHPLPQLNMENFLPGVRVRIESALKAALASPDDAAAIGKLGALLSAHNQMGAAAQCFERARALEPKSFRWTYYLATSQTDQEKSITILQEGLRLDPGYVPARLRLADLLLAGNKLDESRSEYEAVLEAEPQSPQAQYGAGRYYSFVGDTAKAATHYRKAVALFGQYGAANYALALLLRQQGKKAESEEYFRFYEQNKTTAPPLEDPLQAEIAELNAGAMAHIHRAAELEQAGKLPEAVLEHSRALEIDPKLVQAHVNLISLYGRLGQIDKAEQFYRSAIALDTKQADAYYNYGILLFNRKELARAESQFRQTLEINPYHAQAHHNLGFLFEQKGDLVAALQAYEMACNSQAAYPLARFHAGRILAAQRHYPAAIAHFSKALQPEDDRTPSYLYALAATYVRSGNRSEGARYAHLARNAAASFGQSELMASIDHDFPGLEKK